MKSVKMGNERFTSNPCLVGHNEPVILFLNPNKQIYEYKFITAHVYWNFGNTELTVNYERFD